MRQPHIFQIGSTNYTTREYCQSKGITDDYAIKKIQWRINTYIRNHPVRETTEELIRLVSLTTQKARTHKACGEKHEPDQPCKPIDGIRPWQGTKKEREIAQQQKEAREAATRQMITQQHNEETKTKAIDQRELLKKTRWMEHNKKWLNEAGILPNAEDIKKANKPTYDPAKIISAHHPDLKQAVKQYAQAIQRVDELKTLIEPLQLELEEAQTALNEWHTKTINILNTANYKFQKWIGSE